MLAKDIKALVDTTMGFSGEELKQFVQDKRMRILTADWVLKVKMRHLAKFRGDRSNHC